MTSPESKIRPRRKGIIKEFITNVTSRRDTPPARMGRQESLSHSPELTFLKNGELIKLVKNAPLKVTEIAASIVFGKERDFTADTEHLAKKIEHADILGTENIPTTNTPLIIAPNHPDLYDLVAGTIHITNAINAARRANDVPGDIHWMITTAIPPRDARRTHKTMYKMIDWGLRKLNGTYDFIPVPIVADSNGNRINREGRAQALATALAVLHDPTGSRIVGIFPEGDITKGETLDHFYKGVGVLATSHDSSDETSKVAILPTSITRVDKKLTIRFGEPITATEEETVESITDRIRTKINDLASNINNSEAIHHPS